MELEDHTRKVNMLPCAECGSEFSPAITHTTICPTCLSKKNDITAGIPKELLLQWCRYCGRFYGPPWTQCLRESKELLSICLKKVKGLNKLKMIDAAFIYTEEHSKRIRVKITVQKEVASEITLQQTFQVEFTEVYTQCDDCKKDFTPHTWMACVQLRQKTENRKTLLYLEQLMLKHGAHKKASKISTEKQGINFYFTKRPAAIKLVEFISSTLPTKVRESKELVSHNVQNGEYNYKFTTVVEIPRICKDDLVVVPKKLCKEFGGLNSLTMCFKVSTVIHLFDLITLKKVEMSCAQYFAYQHEFRVIPFKGNETEFFISDIRLDGPPNLGPDSTFADISRRFARAEVTRSSDYKQFSCTTHMGHILKHGDTVLGFDLTCMNYEELDELPNQKYKPDVILVRKIYPERKKKIWKLKRMEMEEEHEDKARNIEAEHKDFEEFMEELEQDKYLRSKMNLYRDEQAIVQMQKEAAKAEEKHTEVVQLEELMKEMKITESEDQHEKILNDVVGDLGNIVFKKKQ